MIQLAIRKKIYAIIIFIFKLNFIAYTFLEGYCHWTWMGFSLNYFFICEDKWMLHIITLSFIIVVDYIED